MQIKRSIEESVKATLESFPASAIVGARQVGKTTLAKRICAQHPQALYLDLERPSDLAKLEDAEFFLEQHAQKLVCLDEIQRKPEIFSVLRSLIDDDRRPGRFLILGSASPALLRQSSESLAGRIAYHELETFMLDELAGTADWKSLMERGGFPDSIFARDLKQSLAWRENFLISFMERDLPAMGLDCNPVLMRRLWLMLAHSNGQVMNLSKLGQALDVTHPTISRYLEILCGSFMLLHLGPYLTNTKKRLVKAPKYYLNDAGVFNTLLELETFDDLYHHPGYGSVWEGLAIQHLIRHLKPKQPYGFFRSHQGEEIDFLCTKKSRLLAFEFKASSQPKVDAKILKTMDELNIELLNVITPETDTYTLLGGRAKVQSLSAFLGVPS